MPAGVAAFAACTPVPEAGPTSAAAPSSATAEAAAVVIPLFIVVLVRVKCGASHRHDVRTHDERGRYGVGPESARSRPGVGSDHTPSRLRAIFHKAARFAVIGFTR